MKKGSHLKILCKRFKKVEKLSFNVFVKNKISVHVHIHYIKYLAKRFGDSVLELWVWIQKAAG